MRLQTVDRLLESDRSRKMAIEKRITSSNWGPSVTFGELAVGNLSAGEGCVAIGQIWFFFNSEKYILQRGQIKITSANFGPRVTSGELAVWARVRRYWCESITLEKVRGNWISFSSEDFPDDRTIFSMESKAFIAYIYLGPVTYV